LLPKLFFTKKQFILEQKILAFFAGIVPLSVPILCAEPRHIMISTAIGAKENDFAFLSSLKINKKQHLSK
jgi:hypothetical protein